MVSAQKVDNLTSSATSARCWTLTGRVQGVGFRPFVYRLAQAVGVNGWVKNSAGIVEIHAQGSDAQLQRFETDLLKQAPDFAQPAIHSASSAEVDPHLSQFSILRSDTDGESAVHIPPDLFVCDDCLRELSDPDDRRYRYPFINCTQCGPRYTLIRHMPYDRPNTTMAEFKLCKRCEAEYKNPDNRRFHAEPVACRDCGPSLHFSGEGSVQAAGNEMSLLACVEAFKKHRVIAVRGVGGYHLMCDARSDQAVQFLRDNKPRPDKPLAVMFPAPLDDPLAVVSQYVELTDIQADALLSAERPVVLAKKSQFCSISEHVAPGLDELGVMLPYSPLHHLLLNDFAGPLVATSANISGEPVLTEADDVATRLAHVVHGWLNHNRPIHRPIDDPVVREIAGKVRPIRLGRGIAPLELSLPFRFQRPVLAVGGQMKNTVGLGWDNRMVISPHIGEMNNPRSMRLFESTVNELQRLYDVSAEVVVCDAHPGYAATRWARQGELPVEEVFHHHAHASAATDLEATDEMQLAFTWDGVGFGEDGHLWGGETLIGKPGQWQRIASFRPFRLPGGERASREPWRSAAALCWELGLDYPEDSSELNLLYNAWDRKVNAPVTTAVGRIFDAAASLGGLCKMASFEGQGPMYLEAAADGEGEAIHLPLIQKRSGLLETDWAPLVKALLQEGRSLRHRAVMVHATFADVIVRQAQKIHAEQPFETVTLSGGVFQNKRLTETAIERLQTAGFRVHLPELIPLNDAGLSAGQLIEFASRR